MGVSPASVESPELGVERLSDGAEARLSDYEGRVVFLNFWATWCAPCVEEMPAMQVLQDALGDDGLAVVAVNVGESSEQVTRFVDMLGLRYDILLDHGMRVTARYNVRVMPTTLIIDRSRDYLLRDSAVIQPMQETIQTILPRSETVSPDFSAAATKSNPEIVNPQRPAISVSIFMFCISFPFACFWL